MELIGSRLGNDADLPPGAGAVLCRIVVRIDSEFLNVLKTRLKAEPGRGLPVQVAGRCVHDTCSLNPVIPDFILLIGPATESEIVEIARTAVYSPWRHEIKL